MIGLDPTEWLRSLGRLSTWLDLCSGEALALRTAAVQLGARATVTRVDLVGPFAPGAGLPNLELITSSFAIWSPVRTTT